MYRESIVRNRLIHFPFCANVLALSVLCMTSHAQVTKVHSFGPTPVQGSSPRGNLIQTSDGSLFGVTSGGGSNDCGTIFKMLPNGSSFQVLHHFAAGTTAPLAGLVEAQNGDLYGTLRAGGSAGSGVIFRIGKNGSGYSVVHEFNTTANDGRTPVAELLRANDSYLYGTTSAGGVSNLGTIFRIRPNGSGYSVLYHFVGTNGAAPYAGLIEGTDGILYGTTRRGGSSDFGVAYRVQKDGNNFGILRQFLGKPGNDGREPLAELVQAKDGVLYGTTYSGGSADVGCLFKVNTNGTGYGVIYHCTYTATGYQPVSGLAQAPDGFLYGTFSLSGSGFGVVFRIGTQGSGFSVLRAFTGTGGDGGYPYSPLVVGLDGALYGSTFSGGDYMTNGAEGTIFAFPSIPVSITNIATGPNGYVLSFANGAAGQTYRVLATTNRLNQNWIDLGPATAAANGTFQFTDSNSASYPMRFYRSRTP